MEYYKKKEWVENHTRKIELYKRFINAIQQLIESDLVKSFDGKTITKRQTDKIQAMLPEDLRLDLQQNWDCLSFRIWAYDGGRDGYCVIAQYNNDKYSPMYLRNDRKFDYDSFITSAKRSIEILKDWIEDWQKGVDRIDEVQEKYRLIEKYIEEQQKDIPMCLKVFINFRNPIYD